MTVESLPEALTKFSARPKLGMLKEEQPQTPKPQTPNFAEASVPGSSSKMLPSICSGLNRKRPMFLGFLLSPPPRVEPSRTFCATWLELRRPAPRQGSHVGRQGRRWLAFLQSCP